MLDFVAIDTCFLGLYFIVCFSAVRKRMGFLGVQPISGDCKERVTLCSGFSGVKRPEWVIRGKALIPSGEPTTTKAERVVIVGYNRKPFFFFGDWLRVSLTDRTCLFLSTCFCKYSFKSLHPL